MAVRDGVLVLLLATLLPAQPSTLPLAFEPGAAGFVARGSGYGISVTAERIGLTALDDRGEPARLALRFEHAEPLRAVGEDPLPGFSHYLRGSCRDWRTHVPHYRRVRCDDVYAGVDLVLYGNGRRLEYDFVVAAGADADAIRVIVEGVVLSIDAASGDLCMDVGGRLLRQSKPIAFQECDGERRPVEVDYVLSPDGSFGFRLGAHDAGAAVVIDPVLAYASYLGGTGVDRVYDIVTDAAGNAYVTGLTAAADFPASAFDTTLSGLYDAFVAKISADGSTLLWATYLGGSGQFNTMADIGVAIGVDALGRPVVLGHTDAADFPVVNAAQPTIGGNFDAFVTMLAADGASLVWSTFLGGSGYEITFRGLPISPYGGDLAVQPDGTTFVFGHTNSADFPVRNARQPVRNGSDDTFVTRFDPSGQVVWSTYHGGSSFEFGRRIVFDPAGNLVLGGDTLSSDYPVSSGAYAGTGQGFVTVLDPSGQSILRSTRFPVPAFGLAVDAAGAVYLAGGTSDRWFPVTPGAWQTVYSGANDASRHGDGWIARLDAGLTALQWCTLLGTYDVPDSIVDIKVDATGHVHGMLNGTAVPGGPPKGAKIVKINSAGSGVAYEFRVAGASGAGTALALDANGSAWAAGFTTEDQVPTTAGSFQPVFVGPAHIGDGWLARIDDTLTGVATVKLGTTRLARGSSTSGAVTIDGRAPAGGFQVSLAATPPGILSIPAQVTVPAGSSTAGFTAFASVDSPRVDVTVTATGGGLTVGTTMAVWPGPTYRVVDLGPLGAEDGRGINNSGRTCGHDFVYDDTSGLTPVNAALEDLNEFGQACGTFGSSAVVYTPGQGLTTLPLFAGAQGASAQGLSDLGQVAGSASLAGGNSRAFRYTPGVGMVDLGTLPTGVASSANDVNNAGVVVGESFVNGGAARRAFRHTDATGMVDLGTLPGDAHAVAAALNDVGEIVGVSANSGFSAQRGFRWRNGTMQDLGTLPGHQRSFAFGLNEHGHAVGFSAGSGFSGQRAVLYTDAFGMQDLQELLDPDAARRFELTVAHAIDDTGRIVGSGTSCDAGPAAFRLDPINAMPYGAGCVGSHVVPPSFALEGLPARGETCMFRVAGGLANSACALLIGTAPASASIGGCQLLVGGSLLPPLGYGLDGDGRLALPVALAASLPQATFYVQAVLLDPGSANQLFTTTNGLRIELR